MVTSRKTNRLAQLSDDAPSLHFTHADGVHLFDSSGQKYLDLISGIAVNNMGHNNRAVIQAITKQAKTHLHLMVYGEYIQGPQLEFANLLVSQLPKNLNTVYPVNSGSEAVEGALKLSRRYTGRKEIISFHRAYHGSTFGALSVMGTDRFKAPFEPLVPHVKFIHFNKVGDLDMITPDTACVIIEPIQGEAGYIPANKDFLEQLSAQCKKTGTLLVMDEVQTGMGRTGSLFAFEQYGIVPDVLILAKALGGGMPLGAFISDKSIMDCLKTNPHLGHITTFGGHPLSCTAAIASLEELLKSNVIQEVDQKGDLFRKLLQHEHIKEVRGQGLMLAVDLGNAEMAKNVIDICFKKRLVTDWFLFSEQSIRISPPLIITPTEIRFACKTLLGAIDQAAKQGS